MLLRFSAHHFVAGRVTQTHQRVADLPRPSPEPFDSLRANCSALITRWRIKILGKIAHPGCHHSLD